jgi:hypothetical protein
MAKEESVSSDQITQPAHADLAIKIGIIQGSLAALEGKVDGIAEDVRSLLTREEQRTGAERQQDRAAERSHRIAGLWAAIFGGGIGATLITGAEALLRHSGSAK